MTLETRKEKVIFYAIVPIAAAVAGAVVTNFIQGTTCLPEGGADMVAIIKDSTMSGPDKLKALQIYKDITARPWDKIGSVITLLFFVVGSMSFAVSDWIRKR